MTANGFCASALSASNTVQSNATIPPSKRKGKASKRMTATSVSIVQQFDDGDSVATIRIPDQPEMSKTERIREGFPYSGQYHANASIVTAMAEIIRSITHHGGGPVLPSGLPEVVAVSGRGLIVTGNPVRHVEYHHKGYESRNPAECEANRQAGKQRCH
jgi:hypothetical protein